MQTSVKKLQNLKEKIVGFCLLFLWGFVVIVIVDSPESLVRLWVVSREEAWRLHWSEIAQTELERHDQECFFSLRGRTG